MPDQTYQLPRDSTMQGIVTQLQNIASRMNNSGSGSGGSGGGSTVVANPSGTASDDLTSIEIDGTIYDIPSGSGSSYDDTALRALIAAKQDALTPGTGIQISNGTISCTVQGGSGSSGAGGITTLDDEIRATLNTSYELEDSISNYDLILFEMYAYSSSTGNHLCGNALYKVSDLLDSDYGQNIWMIGGTNNRYIRLVFTDSTHYQLAAIGGTDTKLKGVYGIKLGGSSSGSSGAGGISNLSVVTEHYTGGDNTTTRTFTLPDNRTPFMVNIKGLMVIEGSTYWNGELNFKWGDSFAFGSCTSANVHNQLLGGNDYVTYSGNTFTIQGYNIGYAFNTTTSDFDVTYIYLDESSSGSSGSSGGSGYTVTNLFTGSASAVGDYELSDSILNYDDLEFIFKVDSQSDGSSCPYRIGAQEFYDRFKYGTAQSDDNMMVDLWDNMAFRITLGPNDDPESIHVLANYVGSSVGSTLVCVNGIKYGSGGNSELPNGSGYEATLIYDGSALSSLQSSIELNERWDNYDALYLTFKFGGDDGSTFGGLILKEQLLEALNHTYTAIGSYTSNYVGAHVVNDYKTFNQIYGGGNQQQNIYAVYGLKFGAGGSSGVGGERIVEKIYTATDNTVGVTVETDKPMTDYDYIIVECNEITGGPYINTQIVLKEELQDAIANSKAICPVYLNDGWHAYYYVTDESTLTNKTSVKMYISAVYGVKEGSGGSSSAVTSSYDETVLYSDDDSPASGEITLDDDVTNYDLLIFKARYTQSGNLIDWATTYPAKKFATEFPYVASATYANARHLCISNNNTSYVRVIMGSANNKLYTFSNGTGKIVEVIGIKYGGENSSSQGSSGIELPGSEIIEIAAGDGTSSRTFTFTRKPKLVHVWFTVPEKWSMSEDIFWGQPWGVYNCTNGNAPYSSGAQGSNTITFDDNNLTMTIIGINALGCANNSNGYGYMWVEYGEGSSSGGSSSLAESDKYSTSEKVIGKWVNGKPLYQKTLYNAGGVQGPNIPIAHGVSNLGILVEATGTCYDSGNEQAWFPVSHISSDGYNIGIFSVDSTNVNFCVPAAFNTRITDIYVTIKYTKTTD